jgi:hypothetical protein
MRGRKVGTAFREKVKREEGKGTLKINIVYFGS